MEEYLKRMLDCSKDRNLESSHADADEVLCDLLRELGYTELIDLYESIEKIYT